MAKIEKPSRITQIPVAPGIKLENLIQFDGDCIDPVALVIIIESLDYALETSARRLETLGKIFSDVEKSAYASGHGILPTIKAIRNALLLAPQCIPAVPKPQPPPGAAIVTKAVTKAPKAEAPAVAEVKARVKPVKKTELEAMLETLPKEIQVAATAEYKKLKEAAEPETEVKALAELKGGEPSKRERELWGKAYFKGEGKEVGLTGEYKSPGALAEALGISIRGARNTPTAFRKAGFEVKGNGEVAVKGETGFIVKRVGPTPVKYRRVKKASEPKAEYLQPLRKTATGWVDAEGKEVPPEEVAKLFGR